MQCGPHVHNLIEDIKVQIATSIYTHKHICEKLGWHGVYMSHVIMTLHYKLIWQKNERSFVVFQ